MAQARELKSPPVVVVEWLDAWCDREARDREEVARVHRAHLVRSVGFLLQRDKVGITLQGCHDESDEFDRELFIPAGIVKSVRKLK